MHNQRPIIGIKNANQQNTNSKNSFKLLMKREQMSQINFPVEEFTTPTPVTATENESIDRLIDLMNLYDIRHLPIVKNGRVIGIISDRDLKVASGLTIRKKINICAADIMVTDPVTVSAGATLDEVAFEMSQKKSAACL